jgi:hypothetical protein
MYARWHESGETWLYNRKNDPYELNNLAGKAKYADVQKRMEQRLKKWMKQTNDPFDTGRRDPRTGMLKLGQKFIHNKWKKGPYSEKK